jgi:ABC-2 type transport system ATP-binding protein
MSEGTNDIVLEVKNLTKDYGSFRAVDHISFSLSRGKIMGFLGPNGAGKTTTIHMLLGLSKPTAGEIAYFGKNFYSHREESLRRINYTSAYNQLQGRISVIENLNVFAELYAINNPKKKIGELSEYLEIQDLFNKSFWDLSAGQKTRVNIVKSLLNDPEVLLMDEPTASLDPDIADKTMSLIERIQKERNISILFTSHKMDEVERLCDRVLFLQNGKIFADDAPENLTKNIKHSNLSLVYRDSKDLVEKYLIEQSLKHTFKPHNGVDILLDEQLIPKTLFGLSQEGIWISDIEIQKPNLEDLFIYIARGRTENNETLL